MTLVNPRTLDDDLRAAAEADPDAIWLTAGERRVSYGEADRAADAIGAGLRERGIERGDRVAVVLPNCVEAALAVYGILRAGAAFSPLNPTMKADKLGDVLADAGAKAVIADHALHGTIEEARRTAASVQTHVEVGGGELTLDELAASAPSPRRTSTSTSLRSSTPRARPGAPRA